MASSPLVVGILIYDDVEVLDCCGPFEVFSVANRLALRQSPIAPFEVALLGNRSFVTARGGLVLQPQALLSDDPAVDVLLVAGGVTDEAEKDPEILDWLARVRPELTASVCTGAFLLAEAGLLTSQRVTTHWEDQQALQERYPALRVEADRRWVRDGAVFTSGGISAGIDLSLHLVEVLLGREHALATAHQMEYRWTEDTESEDTESGDTETEDTGETVTSQ